MISLSERFLATPFVKFGRFRCPAGHPAFSDSGPAKGHLIVFPRESVMIAHRGKNPVVANPNVIMFYNRGADYHRQGISEFGDRCDFLDVDEQVLTNSIRRFVPDVTERPRDPFPVTHCLSSNSVFLSQRKLFDLSSGRIAKPSPGISELSLAIIDQVVELIYGQQPPMASSTQSKRHQEIAFETQSYVCKHYCENIELEKIAKLVGNSRFHLCRVFKSQTGISIHQFLLRLRLRVALEQIKTGHRNLTQIATSLGFNSHSHFTEAFRRAFSVTPSQWRQEINQ